MALYVLLLKESEDETNVVYKFGPDETTMGRVQLNKTDGKFEELLPVPGAEARRFFLPAVATLLRHRQEGIFPERTCHAS